MPESIGMKLLLVEALKALGSGTKGVLGGREVPTTGNGTHPEAELEEA
jgi:hypothetical protein